MGYTTDFYGRFELDKPLDENLARQLELFSEERHGGAMMPFAGYPGLWCDWVPTKDRKGIEWNGAEKFYHYAEWLDHVIKNFLVANGYTLNGEVEWQGEDPNDFGLLVVKDNVVTTKQGKKVYE